MCNYLALMILIWVSCMVLTLLTVSWVVCRIVQPLGQLNAATSQLTADNLANATLQLGEGPIEVIQLSRSYNSLAWNGDSSLWRCSPNIDENGDYTDVITGTSAAQLTAQRLVEDMTSSRMLSASSTTSGQSNSVRYRLCIRGLTNYSYAQSPDT